MLGHLVFNRYAPANEGFTHVEPTNFGWLRRVLGALFRRY